MAATVPASIHVMLTTNAGLEALAEAELLSAAAHLSPPISPEDVVLRPHDCFGRVLVRRPNAAVLEPDLVSVLLSLRSVHDVLHHHRTMQLPEVANAPLALYEALRSASLDDGGPCPLLGLHPQAFAQIACAWA